MDRSNYICITANITLAACFTNHLPTIFSWLPYRSHTKKAFLLTKRMEEFSGGKGQANGPVGREKKEKTEKAMQWE